VTQLAPLHEFQSLVDNLTFGRMKRAEDLTTDDYHALTLIRNKYFSVRKGEQSCFTNNFRCVKVSKGESKMRAIVNDPASEATYFGSSATTAASLN
jgi:hypothetical protein